MSSEIKQYWEERARAAAENPTATTDDIYLRELEIRTFSDHIRNLNLPAGARVLDVGCGDGFSTTRIAAEFPSLQFTGVDYSGNMIATAKRRQGNVTFQVGDATQVGTAFASGTMDVVMTDRCLINLDSPQSQYDAIQHIHKLLKPGGHYLAIENFQSGQSELNRTRQSMGLKEIPVRWHNLFFDEDEFLSRTRSLFQFVEIQNFSSAYYYATRVIYSKYCQVRGEEPDYRHEIHQLAVELPPMGAFSPIKLALLNK